MTERVRKNAIAAFIGIASGIFAAGATLATASRDYGALGARVVRLEEEMRDIRPLIYSIHHTTVRIDASLEAQLGEIGRRLNRIEATP